MALFRPYTRDESKQQATKASDLVGRGSTAARGATRVERATPAAPVAEASTAGRAPAGKDRPTPSRRQQERARMERLHPTLTKKEQKAEASRLRTESRLRAQSAVENRPERVLLRNFIDSRWHLGEFTMPGMILLMVLVFAAQYYPAFIGVLSVAMYAFLLLIIADVALTWFRFKRVLRERIPSASTRGLFLYCMNRVIQIRRFRVPPPTIRRGDAY